MLRNGDLDDAASRRQLRLHDEAGPIDLPGERRKRKGSRGQA